MPRYKDGAIVKVGDIVHGVSNSRGGKFEDGVVAEILSPTTVRVAFITMGEGGPTQVEYDGATISQLTRIGKMIVPSEKDIDDAVKRSDDIASGGVM